MVWTKKMVHALSMMNKLLLSQQLDKGEHIPFKPRLLLLTFEFSLLLWSLVAFKFENGSHQMEMTAMHKSNNFQICPTEQISLPDSGKYDWNLKFECVSSISFCSLGRQYCKSKNKTAFLINTVTNKPYIYLSHIILTIYHNDFDDHDAYGQFLRPQKADLILFAIGICAEWNFNKVRNCFPNPLLGKWRFEIWRHSNV